MTCQVPGRRSRRVCPPIADIGDRFAIPVGLSALAGLAAKEGRPRAALRLAGAAAAYEEVNQTYRPQKIRAVARRLAGAGPHDGRRCGGEAVRRGTRADARRGHRARPGRDAQRTPGEPGPSSDLTRREREIAALVATGLTNREIAGKLYLSVRTVEVHVDHILTKLGLPDAHPAGGVGTRGRSRGAKYVAAT